MSLKLMDKGDRLSCAQAAEDTGFVFLAEMLRDFKRVRAYDDKNNATLFVGVGAAIMAEYGDAMYKGLPALIEWYTAVKKSGRRW